MWIQRLLDATVEVQGFGVEVVSPRGYKRRLSRVYGVMMESSSGAGLRASKGIYGIYRGYSGIMEKKWKLLFGV